MSQNLLD